MILPFQDRGSLLVAFLEKPVLPQLLLIYRKLSGQRLQQEIASLHDKYLWCSVYRRLNDPMEGFYRPSGRFRKHPEFDRVVDNIFDAKQKIGICSFSDTCDNELMWTHYADNYRGICIGYRPRSLLKGLPKEARLTRLGYGTTPPELGKHDSLVRADEAARKVLSHKKSSWLYEREWRVFGPPGKLHFDSIKCIAELRLGSRISNEQKKILLEKFSNSIRIYQMTVEDYEHRWQKLSP
jgi:Protein of unknown function (DUF2971)